MKVTLLSLAILFFFLGCKNEPEAFMSQLSRNGVVAGSWKIAYLKVNGEENYITLSMEKIYRDGCDTQLLYHRDSLAGSYIIFGETGEYYFDKEVMRIDTSFLMDGTIDDTSCTIPYVYTREPFDTILRFRGFWTFTGPREDADNSNRLYLFDRNRAEAQIWDIVSLTQSQILLTRQYFDKNEEEVTEEMLLVPQ